MAVYKRSYHGYSGAVTAGWSRFFVIYRFARQSLFRSRFQTGFFTLCFFFPLLCLAGIYANGHLSIFSLVGRQGTFLTVNGAFFFAYMSVQTTLAFLLTAFVGPGLVSPDLANGALTLYLCRPLSRLEYILGKLAVLVILLSWITWLPGLVLYFAQGGVEGSSWLTHNVPIAAGILIGSFLWILVLSLLSLALSAWVKWRLVAGALLLAIFFMGAGFGRAVNGVLGTNQGYLLDLSNLIAIVEHRFFKDSVTPNVPVLDACVALFFFCACCFALLIRKVKPNELVQ